ncbi:MAG TPA: TIGR00299 family protein, partial [Nitrospira sp.]|nr:TIGR00299 family protein [Nitrospira sp.]
ATLAPVTMKKGRPGNVLSVLAPRERVEAVLAVLFSDTTALGVRTHEVQRRVLPRRFESVKVRGREVRIKVADHQPGLSKAAPEYEDCKRIAEQSGSPVKDILDEAMVTFRRTQGRQKRAT